MDMKKEASKAAALLARLKQKKNPLTSKQAIKMNRARWGKDKEKTASK